MNGTIRRALATGATSLIVASGLAVVDAAVVAAPAGAASGTCTQAQSGKTRTIYSNARHTFVLTDAFRAEVAKGTTYSEAVKFSSSVTKTNSVKLSAEVSTKFSAGIFAEAEAKIGGEYGHVNTKTELRETTRTWTIASPGVYYISRGLETFTINVAMQRCRRPNIGDPSYMWMTYNSGKVAGFGRVEGAVRCGSRYSGDFRAFVQQRRCPR